jgi:AraC-like DNA-binding protein
MANSHTVPHAMLASLFSGAIYHRTDLDKVLKNAALDICEFDLDLAASARDNSRLDLAKVGPLLRSLWREMGDEASGFLSRPYRIGMFGMMCQAIISAGNLRRALIRSGKFISLLGDDLSISLVENGDEAQLEINYTNPHKLDEVFFITSIFVIWIRLSCWLIQRPMLLDRIEFQFSEPSFSDEFSLMFPCRHAFSKAKNMVVFNKKLLSLPITQDSDSLAIFLHDAPESLLTQFRSDQSSSAQIKRLLLHRNGMATALEKLSFDVVAQELHTTTHTLRRRLKDEGNSFQEIKDSIRRDQAMVMLDKPENSIQSIAEHLGFSESAAFSRAFKKWTGLTPGVYRDK